MLEPMRQGHSIGVVSEAGFPAVADPGSDLVAAAQRHVFRVEPLVGPSSIILALMGSGFNGQNFAFRGYLPIEQKQRTAAARALITAPRLLLADEPTGALDSRAASDLLSMFNEVNQEGQTILTVTHSAQAASHASRVLFIKDGQVFHQIYRGTKTRQEMYQMIADTLTILTTGGESHA